jgi:bacillithiol biosynthesis cysteine-adding enzyme BshC
MLRVVSHPIGPLPPLRPRADAWRSALDAALVAAPGTEPARQRLHQPGALVVTTGQQPGLYTGPLYAVHKALSATALARVLERRWQRPVVPIFWLAGDDHDFAEASTASWVNAAGALVDWTLSPRPAAAPQLSMSEEVLPPAAIEGLDHLEAALPPGPSRDEALAWLRRHYIPGATMHRAYAGALAELLAPFGVLCFDPTHDSVKRAQAPLLRTALERAGALDAALAALPDAGTGIAAGAGATLVFMTTAVGRDRLLIDGEGFRTRRSNERFTRPQLITELERDPARFSANVLLRPVVESALLPTVAYVAGPGEMRYLERQASALYPLLGVPMQVPVPRWSGTVVQRWAERLLGRLHLVAEDVLADDGTLAKELLARALPGDARQAIEALRGQIGRSAGVVGAAGTRIDPVLDRAITGRMQRLRQLTDDLEAVILRHLKRRDDIAYAQFMRLATGLRPHGKPQERVITAASFLGRYGNAWLNTVFEVIAAWAESLPADAP